MLLSKDTGKKIEKLLIEKVESKLAKYDPETSHMPFHYRLLGRDRYAMFSFIQSMNTTFGMSIWEQMAVIIARGAGKEAERQFVLAGSIDGETEKEIQTIHYDLRKNQRDPDIKEEQKTIRKTIKKGTDEKQDPDKTVDLYVKDKKNEYYFDITSVKPNIKEFVSLKLKLLRWNALCLSQDKNKNVHAGLAIPYNPYHPEPYDRWTLSGLFDLKNKEIMVAEEFWNFVGGGKIYDDLLGIFETAGNILRAEIDIKFKKFRKL